MESFHTIARVIDPSQPSRVTDLSGPLVPEGRTIREEIWVWMLFAGLTAVLAILAGSLSGQMFTSDDAPVYLQMARGESHLVPQPYTSRQLGPLLVKGASRLLHIETTSAFIVEGVLSILLLLGIVGFLLVRSGANAFVLAAVGGLSFWSSLFNGLVLPDLLSAALLTVFVLFLYKGAYLAAALTLLPLEVTRESTILVLLCLLVIAWKHMRRTEIVLAVGATVGGMAIVKALIAGGLGNQDGLGPGAYMAGKVVWNVLRNLFGLHIWTNVASSNMCATPRWQTAVHLGAIRQIGVCPYEPTLTLCTVRTALTCFGLLPLLCFYLWRKGPRLIRPEDVWLRFILLYGTISFLLAPALGPALPRLFGYAWPLFAIATPVLARRLELSHRNQSIFLALHLIVTWMIWLIGFKRQSLETEVVLLLLIMASYTAGWFLLSARKVPAQRPFAAPSKAETADDAAARIS